MKPFYSTPRPTSGHHFSDLLTCPQRAWLHYYGNPKDQVQDPAYLRVLQQDGLEHERDIYEKCFPNALRIPERLKAEERHRLTLEAVHAGVPVILQGYINTGDGVGVLDVLELVGSDQVHGNLYRVGEIKRSPALLTAHVLQASWYTELLEKVSGQKTHEACFFLQSGERTLIDLRMLEQDYQESKADLTALRGTTVPPGPHLSKICPSCHWRGVCMPELIATQHISLVPGISRQQAATLQNMGIASWIQLKEAPDNVLEAIGMGAYEIEQVRAGIRNLEAGAPPLHQPLRQNVFDNLQIVILEFQDIAEQRRTGAPPVPSFIHYETWAGQTGQIEVSNINGIPTADIAPMLSNKKLAFYGLTDLKAFMRIAREAGHKNIDSLDLFAVVETFLHSPVPGLELDALYSYVINRPIRHLSVPERVVAVREVVDWMSRSL